MYFDSVFVTVDWRLIYSWVYCKSRTLFSSRWTEMVDDDVTFQERFATRHTFPLTPVYSRCLIYNPGGHSKENCRVGACGEFLRLWTSSLVEDGVKRNRKERGERKRERSSSSRGQTALPSSRRLFTAYEFLETLVLFQTAICDFPCTLFPRGEGWTVNLWVGVCRWGYIAYIGEYPLGYFKPDPNFDALF